MMSTQGQDAMKVCNLCGETYLDYIDFCFNDGEVLAAQASALDAPEPGNLDAPPPPRRMQQPDQLPPTRSATPIPRAKRSLLNRPPVQSAGAYSAPDDVGPEDAPTATPGLAARVEEQPPPAAPASPPTLVPEFGAEESPAPPSPRSQPAPVRPSQVDTMPIPRPPRPAPPATTTPAPTDREEPAPPSRATPVPPPVDVPLGAQDEIFDDLDEEVARPDNRMLLVGLGAFAVVLLLGGAVAVALGVGIIGQSATSVVGLDDPEPAAPVEAATRPVASPEPPPTAPEPSLEEGLAPAPDPVEQDAPLEDGAPPAGDEPNAAGAVDGRAPDDASNPGAPVAAAAGPGAVPKPSALPPADATADVATPDTPKRPGADPGLGAVRIRSTPSGAKVKVDGKEAGLTPIKLDLPVGTHVLALELAGHEPLVQEVQVDAGENDLPAWTLAPMQAAPAPAGPKVPVMIFFSGRVGDELVVDGQSVGQLPARLELTVGSHVFEVRGAQGDFRVTRQIEAKADGGATIVQLAQ